MQRALICVLGVWLAACGMPESYDAGQGSKSLTAGVVTRGASDWRQVPKTASVKAGLQLPGPSRVLEMRSGPLPMVDLELFNQKSFDLNQSTPKFRIGVHYPNHSHCGLRFASTSQGAASQAQWKSLLAEFQISPASPSTWGSKSWEMPQPTSRVVQQGGRYHIEINFTGPQLYLMFMFLETRSGKTWREVFQQTLGLAQGDTVTMSGIACP